MLRSKYRVKTEDGAHFRLRQRASQISKAIVWGPDLLRKGLVWSVNNGMSALFWKDSWLIRFPLLEAQGSVVEESERDCRVEDYWQSGMGWMWRRLTQKLSIINIVMLASAVLRLESGMRML